MRTKVGKWLENIQEKETQFFVHGFRKMFKIYIYVHPPLLFTVGSFNYNLNMGLWEVSFAPRSLFQTYFFTKFLAIHITQVMQNSALSV